jgi:L-serine deaminase
MFILNLLGLLCSFIGSIVAIISVKRNYNVVQVKEDETESPLALIDSRKLWCGLILLSIGFLFQLVSLLIENL